MSTVLSNIETVAKTALTDIENLLHNVEASTANLFKAVSAQIALVSPATGMSLQSFVAIAQEVLIFVDIQVKKYTTPQEVEQVVLPEIQRIMLMISPFIPNATLLGMAQSMLLGMVTATITAMYTGVVPASTPLQGASTSTLKGATT